MMVFVIREKLPSLNEYVAANRKNAMAGARFKAKVEESILSYILEARLKGTLRPVDSSCDVLIDFYEATRRRDVDNIQSATKYILDALQCCGILPNDNRKWVRQIYHRVIDSESDYCVVYLFTEPLELRLDGKTLPINTTK